ncbi:hypothetical protein NMY22_g8139 [Coprinellus aureogranulatus]|nr:hypothetical protein NMY22_g8139 [Coprinellus aureogranulatus]
MGRNDCLRYCPCCKKAVPHPIFEDHKDQQKRKLEADVASLAILSSPPASSVIDPSSAKSPFKTHLHGAKKAPNGLQATATLSLPTTSAKVAPASVQPSYAPATCPTRGNQRHVEIYHQLRVMETENDERYSTVQSALQDFASPFNPSQGAPAQARRNIYAHIKTEHLWMVERVKRIESYNGSLDEANQIFANAMLEVLHERIERLRLVVDPPCNRASDIPVYDTSKFFSQPIQAFAPATLVILMMAVVLNLLSNMTRGPCNFALRMSKLAIEAATHSTESDIPDDIRTARKRFHLDPAVTVYAVCSCSKLHAPLSAHPFPTYSVTCECGATLTKPTGHHNGVAIRQPIHPYSMQDFTDFRGRMYCRAGYEAVIRRENHFLSHSEDAFVGDIKDAQAYRGLRGHDGRPFVDCPTEIRTIWALSYDGYNPGSNKAAGKTASVGSLAMSCLSLPPSLRNRPENIYLAGLIPGPRQPSGEGLNPFLSPLIDVLHSAYYTGTFFSETYEHPEGIMSREAVLPVIADLPGARKVVGAAGHSASAFCMYCHVLRSDINNIDTSTQAWNPKTGQEMRNAAEEWRDAPTEAKRKELYKRNGVRWSELLRLDYWDPVQNTVVDGMHNLFLGLVRHHFREVIGTHWDVQAADTLPEKPPKEKDLKRGRHLLDSRDATIARLEKLTRPALYQLCLERGAKPVALPGKKIHKRQLAVALLVTLSIDTW